MFLCYYLLSSTVYDECVMEFVSEESTVVSNY
jgi:hypothetical protein